MAIADINAYKENGITTVPLACIERFVPFLQEQALSTYSAHKTIRPWHLCELHNPWGPAASIFDSWKFLELCESAELLEPLIALLGQNIILYDSHFSLSSNTEENADNSLIRDYARCPVEPPKGIVVRIFFLEKPDNNLSFSYIPGSHDNTRLQGNISNIYIKSGLIIFHDINLLYHVNSFESSVRPVEYVIRFFPATSYYLRDPSLAPHRLLTLQYPLINYAKMPLWLVHGEDKADNDFVTGFQRKAGRWVNAK